MVTCSELHTKEMKTGTQSQGSYNHTEDRHIRHYRAADYFISNHKSF